MKILGYRVWTTLPGLLSLRSHHAVYTWKPGENVATYGDAWIGLSPSSEHPVIPCTEYNCPCGFWAYDTPEHALNGSQASHKNVLGVVLGYGRVLLGESGWRAEKARIIGIAHGWRTDLAKYAEHYQVPLVAMDKLDWLIEEHGGIAMADVPKDWTIDEVVRSSGSWSGILGGYGFGPMSVSSAAMTRAYLSGMWPPSTPQPSYVKGVGTSFTTGQPITYDIDCSCGYRTKCASMLPQPTIDIVCAGCSQKLIFQPNNPGTWGQSSAPTYVAVTNPRDAVRTALAAQKKQVKTYRNTRILHAAPPVGGPSVVVLVTENTNADVDYVTDEALCSCGGTTYHARQKHLPFVGFKTFCVKCHQKLTVTAADLLTKPSLPPTKNQMIGPLQGPSAHLSCGPSPIPKFDFQMRSHGKMQGFDITSAWIDDAATGKLNKGGI